MPAELEDVVSAINSLKTSIEAERTGTSAKTADELELENKMLRARSEMLSKELSLEEDLEKKAKLKADRLTVIAELVKRSDKSSEKKVKFLAKIEARQKKLTKATEKATKATQEATKADEEHAAAVDSVVESISGFLGVSRSYEKTLLGQVKAIYKSKEAQEKLGISLSKTFTAGNIAFSGLAKGFQLFTAGAVDLFTSMEAGTVAFNQATGMSDKYKLSIQSAMVDLIEFKVSNVELANSLSTLKQSFPLSQLKHNEILVASQFAKYEKFGVSVQTSATAFTSLVRSLGRTEDQSLKTLSNVAELGRELGMGAGRLTEDFAQALPRLAIYGKQAEKVFRNVAISSSALGLSVDDVLSLAEGFQTFEGSAQAAGKLNAILGGGFIDNLSLMQASFEDPAKAAEMIKSAFDSAGISVRQMGPAALKASAQAAGFNDVEKFRRFLEGDLSATDALKDKAANLQVDANKIAKNSMRAVDQIFGLLRRLFSKTFIGTFQSAIKRLNDVLSDPENTSSEAISGTAAKALGGLAITKAAMGGIGMTKNFSSLGPRAAAVAGIGHTAARAAPMLSGIGIAKDAYDLTTEKGNNWENKLAVGGGMLGAGAGFIGGAGAFSVPLAAFGAGMGNLLGETLGKFIDSNMPENKAAQQDTTLRKASIAAQDRNTEALNKTRDSRLQVELKGEETKKLIKTTYRDDMSSNAQGF